MEPIAVNHIAIDRALFAEGARLARERYEELRKRD